MKLEFHFRNLIQTLRCLSSINDVCVCVHSATFLKTEERSRTGCNVGVPCCHPVKTLIL